MSHDEGSEFLDEEDDIEVLRAEVAILARRVVELESRISALERASLEHERRLERRMRGRARYGEGGER